MPRAGEGVGAVLRPLTEQAEEGSRYVIASAVKTFEVLFAFRELRGAVSLSEVCAKLDLPRNQVYRCLKSLEAVGLVSEGQGGFSLTPRLLELVPAIQGQSLLGAAQPTLERLRRETGETVNLVVRIEGEDATVCLASFPTFHGVGLMTRVGQRSALHAGAVPKAILAHLPEEERERVLAGLRQLPRYTPFTVLDPAALRAELALTAVRGYSVSDQDFEEGARGVGAPIFSADGRPVAGLSIGGPISRVDEDALARFGPLAVAAAREVSAQLGYLGPLGN